METVRGKDLNLGDTVRLFEGAFPDATVRDITATAVSFYRPYVHHEDFSFTGGVLCFTGVEEFSAPIDSDKTYTVVNRCAGLR